MDHASQNSESNFDYSSNFSSVNFLVNFLHQFQVEIKADFQIYDGINGCNPKKDFKKMVLIKDLVFFRFR